MAQRQAVIRCPVPNSSFCAFVMLLYFDESFNRRGVLFTDTYGDKKDWLRRNFIVLFLVLAPLNHNKYFYLAVCQHLTSDSFKCCATLTTWKINKSKYRCIFSVHLSKYAYEKSLSAVKSTNSLFFDFLTWSDEFQSFDFHCPSW